MSNATSMSPDFIDSECSSNYNSTFEISMYILTAFYLLIGLFFHLSILKIILINERKLFKNNSFFSLFVTDSIASSILIVNDVIFSRLFMFFPPLCPVVSPFFSTPSIILKFLYASNNHARFAKSISQIFMVLNRMTCVLIPATYNNIWRNLTPIACFLVATLPFLGTWNIWISRMFILSVRGGFGVSYIRAVQWASLSMFQSIFIGTALFFTVVCTSVTLFKLMFLAERIKSAEKSLCFTSIFISFTFLLVAVTQLLFAFCPTCRSDELYILQFMAFDTYTLGSAFSLVITNRQLRTSVFSSSKKKRISTITVTQNPSGRFSSAY